MKKINRLLTLEEVVEMCEQGVIFTDSDYHEEKIISLGEMKKQIEKIMKDIGEEK